MMNRALALIAQWELAAVTEAAESGAMNVVPIGPFSVLLDPGSDDVWHNMAIPVAPLGEDADVVRAIEAVSRAFVARSRAPHFEFNRERWPNLPGLLERAGLRRHANHPLMACAPDDFRPVVASGVSVQWLQPEDPDADLNILLWIRHGAASNPPAQPTLAEVAAFRRTLSRSTSRYVLGRLSGKPAGTGVLNPIEGVGEIVGVATLPEYRRRGVAATVTSALVQELFDHGGRLAWLDAEDAIAEALYDRLGFKRIGIHLSYLKV